MTHATRSAGPLAAAERPQPATMPALTIPSRFCGPPGSGNGGYVCGRIAAYLDGQVTVTLRRPPPLATPMAVERDGESSIRIHHGRTLIAEANSSPDRLELEFVMQNILAQGYRPIFVVAGQTLYLAQAPRLVTGGLAFSF